MAPKKSALLVTLLCLTALALSTWAYPLLPEQVASHWGIDSQVNGYMGKFWGVFLVPLIMVLLAALLQVLPRLDPTHRNTDELRQQMGGISVVIILFMLVLHTLLLAWNLDYQVSFNVVLPVLLGGLFFYVGKICRGAKRNWFMGVRTPWTLSSDEVWDATNQRAGKLFQASGIIAILSALVPAYSFWFIIVPVMATALYSVAYSYFLYKKVQ